MATLTIHSMPEELLAKLKKSAKGNGRTVEDEVVSWLSQAVPGGKLPVQNVVDHIPSETVLELRKFRKQFPELWLTDEILNRAKQEGRP